MISFIKERKFALGLISAVFLLSFYVSRHCNLLNLESILEFIGSHDAVAPLLFVLVMAISIIVSPIPSMPLAATSGVLFGPLLGTFYSVVGGTLGAIISFYIARVFGRRFIERILKSHIDFCDVCTGKYIVYFVFFSRLLPIFHFDIISYGAGLTNITLRKFAAATFFGMMPMTFLFAYYGQVLFFGDYFVAVFSMLLIAAIFLVPILIKKYNILGLGDRVALK